MRNLSHVVWPVHLVTGESRIRDAERDADQRRRGQTYGFEAEAGKSPILNIFAPEASSTRALRTRNRLGP
jgi:hypothetical protein